MDVLRTRSWRWFRIRLTYLMSADGPLARALAPEQEPAPTPNWSDPGAPSSDSDY